MGSDEPHDSRCGAKCRGGNGYCERFPATDDNGEPINGRCRFHGGTENIGAPKGSARALTHGACASRETLRRHLDEKDLEWIEDLADRYRRLGSYDEDDPRTDLIYDVCVSSWQRWAARSEAIKNDLTSETVVGVTDDGAPVRREDEHYLAPAADRLSREIRQNLDKLDLLGEEDAGTVDAGSAAQIIAAAVDGTEGPEDTEDDDG